MFSKRTQKFMTDDLYFLLSAFLSDIKSILLKKNLLYIINRTF